MHIFILTALYIVDHAVLSYSKGHGFGVLMHKGSNNKYYLYMYIPITFFVHAHSYVCVLEIDK